jgi:hypothetical protein
MAERSHVHDIVHDTNEKSEDLEMMWWRAAFDASSLVFESADEPLAKEKEAEEEHRHLAS